MDHKPHKKLAKFQLNKLECTVIYFTEKQKIQPGLVSIDMHNDISSCERLINKSPKSNIQSNGVVVGKLSYT